MEDTQKDSIDRTAVIVILVGGLNRSWNVESVVNRLLLVVVMGLELFILSDWLKYTYILSTAGTSLRSDLWW